MHPFSNKFRILVRLAQLALFALPLGLAAWILPHNSLPHVACGVLAVLCVLPCLVFAYVLTILHWKSHYQGVHSDIWGVLLIAETTGWFKLVYLIRHLLPDMMGKGRYAPR